MKDSLQLSMAPSAAARAGGVARVPRAASAVLSLLSQLQIGRLELHTPDGRHLHFGREPGPQAAMHIHDWSVCARVMRAGDIGLAEAFIEGQWSSPDVTSLLRLFLANREPVEQAIYGTRWGALLYRLRHWLNRNSRKGSRKNIHAHYDLGNAFYALWLDGSMNYSSAWFQGDHRQSLPSAQQAKVQRALSEVGLRQGHRLLEIGCGWGAVAEAAVNEFGAQVTGVTLSTEQLAWARARMARTVSGSHPGRAAAADLRLQDYRDIAAAPGFAPFDAVVSIEMFEAVGLDYWDSYFDCVHRCLKPGGLACIQTITIRDDLFERYSQSTDFIQQYIFPGGLLPSSSRFIAAAARHGLVLERSLAFGADYAETLRRWRSAFLSQLAAVKALGFDDRFVRIWAFYLAYCEAAFDSGNTDVVQFTLRRC